MQTIKKVKGQDYNPKWHKEIQELRRIASECGLEEEIKWDKPTFTLNGKNVVIVQGFNKYFAFLFVKGVLIDDGKDILVKVGANTNIARQIRFTSMQELKDMELVVKNYIKKAIEAEKSGKKVPKEKNTEFILPAELEDKLEEMPNLREAWEKLTPGRKKSYLLHFNGTKNSETREARIERCIDKILDGVGFNERY